MKIIITESYEALGNLAASILLGKMTEDKRVNISITAGNTPQSTYTALIPRVKNNAAYQNVHYYNFDEIVEVGEEKGMTEAALQKLFFQPANISSEQIHLLNLSNYQEQDQRIANAGGLDAMLIGIGEDGHFCANMPQSTEFNRHTHEVLIKPEYSWYEWAKADSGEKLPASFVTMGAASIMKVKQLILIANGSHKAGIIKRALSGPIDRDIPASILQLHPNLTVILDQEAAADL